MAISPRDIALEYIIGLYRTVFPDARFVVSKEFYIEHTRIYYWIISYTTASNPTPTFLGYWKFVPLTAAEPTAIQRREFEQAEYVWQSSA